MSKSRIPSAEKKEDFDRIVYLSRRIELRQQTLD
jgi:hypothetical protein